MLKSRYLPYIEGQNYNGIFEYLKKNSKTGNILTEKIISISGTSEDTGHGYSLAIGINNEDGLNWWRTIETTAKNPYIKFDFLSNKISLESIMLYNGSCDYFSGYSIYGINSNKQELIKTCTHALNKNTNYIYFHIPFNRTKKYQSIKIEGNGKRGSGDTRFVIHRIEFFGTFYARKDLLTLSLYPKKNHMIILVLIIISK